MTAGLRIGRLIPVLLLTFAVLGPLRSGGAETVPRLLKLAPAYTAIAAGINLNACRTMLQKIAPEETKLLRQDKRNPFASLGCQPDDVAEFLLLCDPRGRRGEMLCGFGDEAKAAAWLKAGEKFLQPLPEAPGFSRIVSGNRELDDYIVGLVAPGVCGWFSPPRGKAKFQADRRGASEELLSLLMPGSCRAVAFACGMPKLKEQPFDTVEEFSAVLEEKNGKLIFSGKVSCDEPMKASLLQMSFLALASMWLQTEVGMLPEETEEYLHFLKIRQRGATLNVSCDDVEGALRQLLKIYRRSLTEESGALN